MNTVLGAEVYVTKYLFSNEDLSGITYGKSRYILTEFNYTSSFSEKTMNQIVMLIENHGLIPVIPHVERYEMLMSDFAVLQELKDMGVVIQTNVSNYAQKSPFFKRRKLLKLIGDGMIDILGTDAHSMTRSSPEAYSQAIECIADKCGNTAVRRLMKNAEKIFTAAANSAEAEMK